MLATTGHPTSGCRSAKLFLQNSQEQLAILDPLRIRSEAVIAGELRPIENARAQKLKVPIGARTNDERSVAPMEELIGNDRWMLVAVALRFLLCQQHALRNVDQRRNGGTEQRHFDRSSAAGPFASAKRGADSADRVVAGED